MPSLLLDSNALIFYATNSQKLGRRTRKSLDESELYYSPLSLAELNLKSRKMPGFQTGLKPKLLRTLGVQKVSFTSSVLDHFVQLATSDPFDNMLLAQAISNNLKFLTSEQAFIESGFDFVIDLSP